MVRALSTTRQKLIDLGHDVVLAPSVFRNMPAPNYPEIRLALCTPMPLGESSKTSNRKWYT